MKAFTLVELAIAILIFTFIVGGMYSVLNIANTNYGVNLASLDLQRQARQGMSRLSREIRQAYLSSIHDKNTDRISITFDTPYATDVTYSLVSGQLVREYPTGTVIVIANDITGLTFPPMVDNMHKITLEAGKTFSSFGKERTLTFSLTGQVQVRNQ
jgi:hypothetical protein